MVQRLIDAGAIPLGKTNLDQFATGLNGTRSPYGACRNAFDPDVHLRRLQFRLGGGRRAGPGRASRSGTDTAGSGRVPAAFNNLVGHKPTLRRCCRTRGVVPACRSLDAVSIFALTAEDAERVLAVRGRRSTPTIPIRARRAARLRFRPRRRFRFGVPRPTDLQFFGNAEAQRLFGEAVDDWRRWAASRSRSTWRPSWRPRACSTKAPGWPSAISPSANSSMPSPTRCFPSPARSSTTAARPGWPPTPSHALYRLQAFKRTADAIVAGRRLCSRPPPGRSIASPRWRPTPSASTPISATTPTS